MIVPFTIKDVKRQYRNTLAESDVIGSHGAADTVRVHWDIITICDLKCSYCYAREHETWNVIPSKPTVDASLDAIRAIPGEVEVVLLGGEPTLHPRYFYILEQLNSFPNVVSMAIISNAHAKFTPEWVEKHMPYRNFFFNITVHPNDSDIDKVKQAIMMCDKERLVVNIVMLGPKFDGVIGDVVSFCKENGVSIRVNIPFHPVKTEQFLKNTTEYHEWIAKYADSFERYLYFELFDGTTYCLNDIDVYLNKLNRLKGWMCKNNNWSMSTQSTELVRMCSTQTNDEFTPCVLYACCCQGMLSAEKYNPNP